MHILKLTPLRSLRRRFRRPLPHYDFTYPPTFIRDTRVVVSWSTKAGCSNVVLWALNHNRMLDRALAYDEWPHRFRSHVYEKAAVFKHPLHALLRSGGTGHTLIKVTRDPKARLVSIFRHACRFAFLRDEVRETLGFDMRNRGLSLTDFDTVLGQLKLTPPTTVDPHLRVQYSPLWDMAFDRVITLNIDEVDLDAGLNAAERALGLPVTDFGGLPAFGQLQETHHALPKDLGATGPIETHRFRAHQTQAFPKRELMASPLLESMARRYYGSDVGRVGTGDTAGEISAAVIAPARPRSEPPKIQAPKVPKAPGRRGAAYPPASHPFTAPPVFIREADAVVSWSPKAGCSHVVLWAFIHEGCFREASDLHPLPHEYRIDVYQKQKAFRRSIARLRRGGGAGRTLVRVTRDPARRLVSIFRHACRYAFLHDEVRARLGFDPQREGFSLTDLDAVLGQLQLTPPTTADPHLRTQYSPLWDMGFDRVITLNLDEVPLNPGLNAIERALGLPITDFDGLPQFGRMREAHYARAGGFRGKGPIETHRFRARATAAFPKDEILAAPLVAEMAARHYAADIGRVASGDTAGELFQDVAGRSAR